VRALTILAVLLAYLVVLSCASSRPGEATPETCDGTWAVRVSNRLDVPVEVYDRAGGPRRIIGTVPPGGERVFYPPGPRDRW